jgi:phenylpropionate dioxygenase-like ring-hydroxylating dioxygenase large terminal subunit
MTWHILQEFAAATLEEEQAMARWPKPAEGSWTEHYPDLGTEPISYEDSISPEFYELEREAVFKRAWLNVGRVEQLPRNGSYFTKELQVAKTSIIVVRDMQGTVHAFHNICRHRGNKLVWNDFPMEETSGTCRQFTCKYHGWRYDLEGACAFVQQENEFFDLDKSDYGLVPVHCEVWEGFIFVNLAETPDQSLTDFLGPMITGLSGYPFDRMTERWHYRSEVKANWKIYMDAFQEFYHAPILHTAQNPPKFAAPWREAGFEAPHYAIDGPHRVVSTSGIRAWELGDDMRKPIEGALRSGLFGPWDAPDLGTDTLPGVNPAGCDPWGLDSFQLFPNFTILIWGQNWYLTYHYWPTSYNTHVFDGNLYFVPAKSARERIAQELAAVSFKEFGLQDANTLEATQSMLESRAVSRFPLNDQEVLCRHLHKETAKWVDDYLRGGVGAGRL